ncbi:MAG: hypothetical protein Q9225_003424 [Loekoesia sp. 1 TL-2023]
MSSMLTDLGIQAFAPSNQCRRSVENTEMSLDGGVGITLTGANEDYTSSRSHPNDGTDYLETANLRQNSVGASTGCGEERAVSHTALGILPNEIVDNVFACLNDDDIINCWLVCRAWANIFGNPNRLREHLVRKHSRAYEMRTLSYNNVIDRLDATNNTVRNKWRLLFSKIAKRYSKLKSLNTKKHSFSLVDYSVRKPCGNQPRDRFPPEWSMARTFFRDALMFDDEYFTLEERQPGWSYHKGFLVYLSMKGQLTIRGRKPWQSAQVPFNTQLGCIERVSLKDMIVMVGWSKHCNGDDQGPIMASFYRIQHVRLRFFKMMGKDAESMIYFIEQRCRCLSGIDVDHAIGDALPTTFQERVIEIPAVGHGPHFNTSWYDASGGYACYKPENWMYRLGSRVSLHRVETDWDIASDEDESTTSAEVYDAPSFTETRFLDEAADIRVEYTEYLSSRLERRKRGLKLRGPGWSVPINQRNFGDRYEFVREFQGDEFSFAVEPDGAHGRFEHDGFYDGGEWNNIRVLRFGPDP